MIALGCDHGGYELMQEVKKHLEARGLERVYLFLDELTASPVGDRLKLKDESKAKVSLPALEEPGRDGLYLPS